MFVDDACMPCAVLTLCANVCKYLSIRLLSIGDCQVVCVFDNGDLSNGVYYVLIGPRQGLLLNSLVALSLRLCFDAFGYSSRLIRSFGRRGTRGDYHRMTMSLAKSLLCVIDRSPRAFGCL